MHELNHTLRVSVKDTTAAEWDKNTWAPLQDLARNHPEAGVHFQGQQLSPSVFRSKKRQSPRYTTEKRILEVPQQPGSQSCCHQIRGSSRCFLTCVSRSVLETYWSLLCLQFQEIPKSDLKEGVDNATSFTSVCINTAIYLPWLVSQCLKNGVVFKRAIFKHVADAASAGIHHSGQTADLVLNCTGLGSHKLGGVEDKLLYPARGQIVLVRNDAGKMYSISGTDDGSDEVMYIMTRAAGGGTVLGGCYQKGNWESQHDPSLAIRIMKRCVEMCPKLTDGKGIEHLDVIRHGVGLRPVREGNVARVEKEKINGVWVVVSNTF